MTGACAREHTGCVLSGNLGALKKVSEFLKMYPRQLVGLEYCGCIRFATGGSWGGVHGNPPYYQQFLVSLKRE